MSEVYVVLCEWGEYDEWCMRVDGVFATREAAERQIRSHGLTLALLRDGGTADLSDFDHVDAVGTVTRVPVEHRPVPDGNGRRVGGTWYIDGDPRCYGETYTIERWEVRA